MRIERALVEDAKEILEIQMAAYGMEAKLYNNEKLPPLTQTLEEMRGDIEGMVVLKAIDENGRITGSVRAEMREDDCLIGRLIVLPELWGRGTGSALMREIESSFPGARRFELFTGHKSERNIRLYENLGYSIFDTRKVSDEVSLVYLRKERK